MPTSVLRPHWISLVIAFGGLGFAASAEVNGLPVSDMRVAAGALAQVAATMLGFIVAALSILTAVVNNRLMRNMQRTGHYRVLLREMFHCALAFGATAVCGLAGILLPEARLGYALLVAVFFMSYSACVFVVAGRKFWMVLISIYPEQASS